LGRLRTEAHPESGTTTYNYDDAGNLTGATDARGVTKSMAYDPLNRMTWKPSTYMSKKDNGKA
jgi:YD repeat-containing protein